MKTILTCIKLRLLLLFCIYSFFVGSSVFAQSPALMSYQAVVRNSANSLVVNKTIGLQISILQDTINGPVVYSEVQTPKTNSNGLISIEIGGETGFDTIDWSTGIYFIKTEIDPSGGSNYTILGTSQLLSVPYALYSKNTNGISIVDGKYGFDIQYPSAKFDFKGGNNWDLVNGEGDLRIGNSDYRIKMGVATGGGGAGASTIMQYGKNGGYNVLSLGSQGNKILNLNGLSLSAGIGTENPDGKLEVKSPGSTPQLVLNQTDNGNYSRLRYKNGYSVSNGRYWDIAGYTASTGVEDDRLNFYNSTGGDVLGLGGNGAVYLNGNAGTTGQVLQSNGPGAAATWANYGHYVGEHYGGGIVFYVYDNGQHGLIASAADLSTSVRWYAGTYTNTIALGNGIGAGKQNTTLILANQGYGDGNTYAAKLCATYSVTNGGVTYADWYLPSRAELELLYAQRVAVGGFNASVYWSTTEIDNTTVWQWVFNTGQPYNAIKNGTAGVRAIRSF